MDGDGYLEVFFGDVGGKEYGYNPDGTKRAGFPIQLGGYVRGNVAVWDFDEDGDAEIMAQSQDKNVYVWSYTGSFHNNQDYAPWPFFKHDATRTSKYSPVAVVGAGTPVLNLKYEPAGVELVWGVPPGRSDIAGWNVYRTQGERLYPGHVLDGVPKEFSRLNWAIIGFTG